MDITEYVVPAVMAGTWIVLQIVKAVLSEESKIRRFIPLFSAVLGVAFTVWVSGVLDFTHFLQGIASGFAATGLNESVNAVFYHAAEPGGESDGSE